MTLMQAGAHFCRGLSFLNSIMYHASQVGGEVAARLMRGERVTLPAVLGGGASAASEAPGPGDLLASLGMATHSSATTFGGEGGVM